MSSRLARASARFAWTQSQRSISWDFSGKSKQEPQAGFGVKASCGKDGQIKTITFTPPVGEPLTLGEKRLSMTEQELFKEVDKDGSKSISYPEFSTYIYYSPKHGPDSFRKTDQDGNGA